MTTTTNLGLTHLSTGQTQKETTVNDAVNGMDDAIAGRFVHDFVVSTVYTISTGNEDHLHLYLEITDTGALLSQTTTVIVPNNNQMHIAYNNTLESLVFKTAAGSGVTIAPAAREMFYCDATDLVSVAAVASAAYPYDIGFFLPGLPEANKEAIKLPMVRVVEFTSALTEESQIQATVSSTSSAIFHMSKNGTRFGAIKFNVSTVSAVVSVTDTTFSPGDVFIVSTPAQDATLSDVGFNLKAARF